MSAATPLDGRGSGQGSVSLVQAPIANEDAERAVLGALLMYGDAALAKRIHGMGLAPEHFYWEQHGAIYDAIIAVAKRGVEVDPVLLGAEMERRGTRTESTQLLIADLPGYVLVSNNATHYAGLVIEQARWRKRMLVARMMLESIEARDDEAWQKAAAPFEPRPAKQSTGPSMLRIVDEDGEVVGEELRPCDSCQELEDQLKGAQSEIAGWRTKYANLKRDKDQEAARDALWLPAQALFKYWQELTNHKRCKWSPERFRTAEPLLKLYGVEIFARAIAGIAEDPYTNVRKNGTVQKYDSWETLTKNTGRFEEYANRAPRGWEFTLNISITQEQPKTAQPRLALALEA